MGRQELGAGAEMNGDIPPPPAGFTRRDSNVPPPPPGFTIRDKPEEPGLLESVGESVGKAAKAFPGSVAQAGEDLWNLVRHGDQVIAHMREVGFSGVASEFKDDILEHYGSLEKAKHTFETDPFRFLTDVSLPLTAGGGAALKTASMGSKLLRKVTERVAPLTTGAPRSAFEMAGEIGVAGGGPRAGLYEAGQRAGQPLGDVSMGLPEGATGLPRGAGAGAMASPEFRAGQQLSSWRPASSGDPMKDMIKLATKGTLGGVGAGALHAAGIPWWLTGAAEMASTSPRLMGGMTRGLGAAERRLGEGASVFGKAAIGAAIQQPRELLQQQAQAALKDPEFKKGKDQEQLKPVRKVARDPNADSKAMQAAQRVLGGYRPLQLTVRPEQGGYGGSEGGQSNDATSGVVSRQEGGPVTAGRAYSVGDAPGASADTPKPETFIPDRGPSPAQAAGGAATEAVGWVSDAWASILKGEKPPPLPGLPETGKVPSTADPRPTQALGEETSFLSQFAGPPGAAAAKGLGAAALGAAAGKKLLKGAAEEIMPTISKVTGPIKSDAGYVYHATNAERAMDIASSGKLKMHKPSAFTDQQAWPDGSIERRNYFTPTSENTWQFAPEEGQPALMHIKRDAHPFKKE